MKRILVAGVALVSLFLLQPQQSEIQVIDGDTLDVGGQRIRLASLDAPEIDQYCEDRFGASYACGELAAQALEAMVHRSRPECRTQGFDPYGRTLARCSIDGRDIGAELVKQGHALAFQRYSLEYLPEQRIAKNARAGVWNGRFIPPWVFRSSTLRKTSPKQQLEDCSSATTRPQHRGEGRFCSESEALLAGWQNPVY